ncbi:acetyl-CoA C-acetyltransferase [Microbacterium sp. zg.Y1090]|uniref:acetyl-CoA C-acetyltransferase n=1 Tax=Microbacterium TaxID=33882 RepID=UPI00214AEFB6|nr:MULTISPECIES: acetyl-CoA C-acetyltransferase [unclassified Microbacterium]MCR2813319.1 acetyl-CoA C-acetyltransferase [Microbacterium sp. zg.Y1084]MCR2819847.1 acetyl-CoA C-acetyltransferase [Microbacterium sp. zg.Y1090]MDL5487958.1 acetyl-CoA C-acetyltransferase [Microbacterium sp. zg-Y1211]WIM28596.1 acetyl-CoA C-acetyltransferase [Microbacterium sp. zg-Y1090]
MTEAVIVSAARSPIGRAYKGSLKDMRADDLAAQIVRAALDGAPGLDPATVEDLMMGCAQPAGRQGYNIGRMVALQLGLDTVPGTTVNRYCSSSLQTTRMAFHAIKAGEGDVFISAGVETVSQFAFGKSDGMPDTKHPGYLDAADRTRVQGEDPDFVWSDPRGRGEQTDIYIAMGDTAENVASLRGVSRRAQDEWAVLSQNRAEAAAERGFWQRDITPVQLPDGSWVGADDGPRAGVTLEKISGMQPVFRPTGTVTAANCCALNDGAAALVIMSDVRAAELGLTPLARIVATGVSALSPEIMGLGPVDAVQRALAHARMSISDIDILEINEAFAAQVLPAIDDIGIDPEKVNVNGGAIALGHPYGMTGARIATTAIHALQERDEQFAVETMCVAGGQGMALVLERLS